MQFVYIDGNIVAATYIDDVDSGVTNSTSHSLSIDIGAVAADTEGQRLVAIAVHMLSANAPSFSSATIGGVTASMGTIYGASRATGIYSVGWIWALVPTGTSATVAITLSQSALVRFRSFRLVGVGSDTPTHSNGNSNVGNITSLSTTLDVQYGGAALAACTGFGVDTWTISGVTEDYSVSAVWSADGRIVGGHLDVTANETGRTITITTGVFATTAISLAAIAFR